MIVHSKCLPYYDPEGLYVSWFDLQGVQNWINPENFEDVTTDGERAIQFYTFKIEREA